MAVGSSVHPETPWRLIRVTASSDYIHKNSQTAGWPLCMACPPRLGPGSGMRLLPREQRVWKLGSMPACVRHHKGKTHNPRTQKVGRNTKKKIPTLLQKKET